MVEFANIFVLILVKAKDHSNPFGGILDKAEVEILTSSVGLRISGCLEEVKTRVYGRVCEC